MKTKAEQLLDRMDGLLQSSIDPNEARPFEMGDMVTIDRDGVTYVALVEAIDLDTYTVRVQAVAGNEFEATDKVYVVLAEELTKYDHPEPKSFEIGDVVEWKSEAGLTIGEIVSPSEDGNGYVVEVFAQDERKEFEPTYVTVTLSGEFLSKSDAKLKPRRGTILAKMSDITLKMDSESKIGELDGIGSAYGQVDLGGDRVNKGAYTQTIKHKEGKVALFIDHGWDMKTFMGIAHLSDSEEGLRVRAEMPLDATDVRDTFIKTEFAVNSGLGMGYSIGYDAVKSRMLPDGTRELQEIALHEISITPFPMDTQAKILSARSKRIAYKAMQTKWATPQFDAPTGNQSQSQGAPDEFNYSQALDELKSIINPK